MKSLPAILALAAALFLMGVADVAHPGDWDSNSSNWKNNSSNWDNSSGNWKNNASNWDNSASNWGNDRTVYDEEGDAVGYAVPKSSGGVNLYNLDGDREAYTP